MFSAESMVAIPELEDLHLLSDRPSLDAVHPLIRTFGPQFLHHGKGRALMTNHLHLLIRPEYASQLPRLMHWIAWYSAMALNRLIGSCGQFWEARYYAIAIAPKDHRRVLNT